ncbi:MAG: hypothetical protein ACLFTQ_02670 [Candidatus Aenigmatarchaeota archaeon]
MKFQDKEMSVDLEKEVFKDPGKGFDNDGWLWWFWLFFIDDPSEAEKPRQMAVLWSRKDENSITCNGRKFGFGGNKNEEGIVASWYFDGEEMHHNYLLEKSEMEIDSRSLKMGGETPTVFRVDGETCEVTVGDSFHFTARPREDYDFANSSKSSGEYPLGLSQSVLRCTRLGLESEVGREVAKGSAYFQRVNINAPTPSWYWGIFHFENDAFLDYHKSWLFGKTLKEELAFYDGDEAYTFDKFSVEMNEESDLPSFHISAEAENGRKELNFTVKPYSKASWKFRKKVAKVISNKLTYREYPAKISQLEFVDRKKEKKRTLEDLGSSVGNTEYTTGFLL